ncbi:PAS-domain containing protein [Vogesella oryzae]|uniref:PAS-domain containing protein n=1 Tax=Vogesella oryzae TaxID=1735285 RepID=UPI001582FF7F|nr:PAS-domain containing protein [Vogesella oryzae]
MSEAFVAATDPSPRAMLLYGLDLLDQGVTVFDAELKLVACNLRFLQLLDFPEALGQVGTPFEAFIRYNAERGEYGPGDAGQQVAERVALARRFEPHDTERIRPDGSVLRVRGEPLPGGGFISLYTDKTEQQAYEQLLQQQKQDLEWHVRERTAELEAANRQLREAVAANAQITAALSRSEERLRLITDTIPALIAYFDRDHIYRYANRGYADWFGRRNEHIVGRHIEAALGSKFYAAVVDYVNEALSGKQVTYEYSMDKDDGSTIFARSTLVPEIAPDGQVLGCFVLSFDITEQTQTQAALVQAQKMEAVGQLSGGLAHDFNNMLTVVIGNLAELRYRCQQQDEVLDYLDPALQAAERGVALVRRLLTFARQQPLAPRAVNIASLLQDMLQLIRRSLPENIALHTALPAEPLHALADPHQLESAILNLVLNARDAYIPRPPPSSTHRIPPAAQVVYKRRVQKRFTADAAHQLRTPLTLLKTQAEVTLRMDDPAEQRAGLAALVRATDQVIRLANQLLALSRAEPGPNRHDTRELDLAELARAVTLDFVTVALGKALDLGYEGDEHAMLCGQPLLLREMLSNLVDNAVRYTPAGGEITVSAYGRGDEVELVVADSGPGIAAAERTLVFERFYRGQQAGGDGCGLGLAIVREIVRGHGGQIRLENGSAGGLRVVITLPRHAVPAAVAAT